MAAARAGQAATAAGRGAVAAAGRGAVAAAARGAVAAGACGAVAAAACTPGAADASGAPGAGDRGAGAPGDTYAAYVTEVVARRVMPAGTDRHRCLLDTLLFAGGYFLARTVLVDRVSRAISSASSTCLRSRTVPVSTSMTSTTLASSLAVSSLPDWWASATARPSLAVAVSSSPCLRASSPSWMAAASSACPV